MPKHRGGKRKGKSQHPVSWEEGLPALNRNAAGIDVGNAEHYVAVPAGRDPEPVRKFGSFIAGLHRMAQLLKACGIETVVMQATGVYWVALYQILEDNGFQVNVVNARHTKTLPGRKSKPGSTPQSPPETSQPRKLGARFKLRDHLHRIAGVDLTQIDGLDVQTVQIIISEVGVDMSRWNTEKSFASWLGMCPDNRVSSGKILKRGTRQVVNRASTALRLSAWSLIRRE